MLRANRKKACKVCGERFRPRSSLQVVCSNLNCAIEQGRLDAKKRAKREHRQAKDRIKSHSELRAEAQKAFNAFIRLRDDHQPCISCGDVDPPLRFGGTWDCGHYLTVGGYPELRFNELNAHRQCKRCNAGAGRFAQKGRTVQQNYRKGLILRIGLAKVERLEGPHVANNYTRDDLREIKVEYLRKCVELKRSRY